MNKFGTSLNEKRKKSPVLFWGIVIVACYFLVNYLLFFFRTLPN